MKKIAIIILLIIPVALNAQPMNVDSLVNELNSPKISSAEKLDMYYKICGTYLFYDIDKASEYADKGLKCAEKENDKIMLSKFNAIFGRLYGTKSSYDTAFVYYEKALGFAIESKDKEQEGIAYADIGILYGRQDKYTSSLEYFMKALSIFENMGEKQKCVKIMSNIATLYRGMENDERAIYYLKKAKTIVEEGNFEEGKMQVYFELGAIYHKLAEKEHDKINLALNYELKAYELSKKLNHKVYQAAVSHAIADIYSDFFKDYDKALKFGTESLEYAQQTGDPRMMTAALASMSNIYLAQKRYRECEYAASKAWAIDSTSIYTGKDLLKNIILSNIGMGNNDRAFTFFSKYDDFVNTQIDQSSRDIMAEMEAKYETEKKETRITTLEKERKLYIGLGVAIVVALLSAIGLLFYRHRSEKKLVAIRAALKAEKTERDLIARDLHDGVSSLLTVIKNNMDLYSASGYEGINYYNNAFEVLGKSITKLRYVVYHLKSHILTKKGLAAALDDFCRFIPKAKFHFNGISRRFDSDKEYVLYDCACELINNALKHSGASNIDIHLNMDDQTVYISVSDDGCGFDQKTVTFGIGLDNIRSNLSAFGGRLDILSELDKGTEANVEMKV
ncbi:MAG: tetratricopeptide repeat protein [Tannerellaceae bacterium]|jgi:signal transduction histidine kinase|nr:tetratricopeptide repeat protein [Tannerellaceae bacterium]